MSDRQGSGPPAARRRKRHEMVVSLVVRLRLRTVTKAFCNCAVAPDADVPNAHTCPVCLGLPGSIPALNERAVEQAVRAALAIGATVPHVSMFVRAHEFAPGLPKGYRLTQHDRPLATRGVVQIGETQEGAALTVAVPAVRLEEEAGRAVHGRYPRASALDFNLAGAPTLRLATAPTMHSAAAAVAFVRELRRRVRDAGAGDGRFQDGSLRVCARLSTRELGDTGLKTPCDIVGIDSLPTLRAALEYEAHRQRELVDAGGTVERQTMLWDGSGALVPARARGGVPKPRHLAEPDLPPLVLTADWIAEQRERVPTYPIARRERLAREYGLSGHAVDVLVEDPELADYYEAAARRHGDPRTTAEWVTGPVVEAVDAAGGELEAFALRVRPADLAELLDMIRDGRLGPSGARHVFGVMVRTGQRAPRIAGRDPTLAPSG